MFGQKEKYRKSSIGFYSEIRSDTTNLNRYTEDNEIYKAGYRFCYSLEYFDCNGSQRYYTHTGDRRWDFIKKNDSIVVEYCMKILPGLEAPFLKVKDYAQTIIQYSFWQIDGNEQPVSEKTGLVENKKNVWLHPPRTDLSSILELNPFPCIRFPLIIGKMWKGKLIIGDFWGDVRWISWEGQITNNYKYKISRKCTIDTELGVLKCYIVKSVATSTLGKTHLTSYFNQQYGFIRYEYTNIDGSQILINLKKVDVK